MPRKILTIDFMYPLPENIGRNMRTMNFVRFFREYGNVDILYFYPESKGIGNSDIFNREYYIRHPSCEGQKEIKWHQKTTGRFMRLLEKRPWIITEWSPQSMDEYISIILKGEYDIIFCRYILNTYPLFNLPQKLKKRVILDFDDVFSDNLYAFHAKYDRKYFPGLKDRIQKYLLLKYEIKCLEFGAALFTSKYDQETVVGDRKNHNTYVIPNVYPRNMSFLQHEGSGYPHRSTFILVGTLNYGPNIEGLKWFIDTIFKHVSKEIKNAKLIVVGREPTTEVKAICSTISNIELHSDVLDVKPFYEQSGIVVVPILTGGGTRIKILEAGIAGRPVLSTPMGANGLDVIDGKDLFLFHDKDTFMECYGKLSNKKVYDDIISNMKFVVNSLYSPESFHRKLTEAIKPFIYR